ncbi:helix-turn-helix protein [Thioclava sp. ES.031]|uniref:helix-turn-helix domain-containing protein n=1 Tax=Thioclava sp. ES.031 TaxID=1798203 RepID=UPI000BFA16FD|nr:helix-turn-helix protein [Thioclava sp. ES.031]
MKSALARGRSALTDALIKARHESGLTQRDLAKKLGCLPATVANIETGQRRIDVIELIALADALEVPARDLFEIALQNTTPEELFNNFSRATRPRGAKNT